MATTAIGSIPTNTSTKTATGSAKSLQASDFINLLITQLKNQDPTQPMSNSELLQQVSQIGQLQSQTALQTTLQGLALQNQIGSASNLIGTRPDVVRIVRLAHDAGALCYVDGVHLTAHAPIDLAKFDADFFACSPYKFLGPHCGVVAARPARICQSRGQRRSATVVRICFDATPRVHIASRQTLFAQYRRQQPRRE